jgi:hypothetical protein
MASRHERIGQRRWVSLAPEDEKRLLDSSARCVAISSGDRDEFDRLYGVRLPVAPFVPPQWSDLAALAGSGPRSRVGFLGGRGQASEDVMEVIARDEFLEPVTRHGVELIIAGGICSDIRPEQRSRLVAHGGSIMGPVERLEDFYDRVGTVLNPVGPSTGVKVKSVEALLAGRMLVTTEYGADEALRRSFGPQIRDVRWPVLPALLADVVIATLKEEPADAGGTARRSLVESYVRASEAAVSEAFAP